MFISKDNYSNCVKREFQFRQKIPTTRAAHYDEALSSGTKILFTLKAPGTKRQWPTRFSVFLDYLKLQGQTIEDNAFKFDNIILIRKDGITQLQDRYQTF